MDLIPIALPIGWDAAQDCAYLEERWEPVPSYTAALWEWMRFHHGCYVRTLDTALHYFRRQNPTLVEIDLSCLTSGEKIAILQEIAASTPFVAAYRPRLLEALAECEFAEAERGRVLRDYRLAGEHAWLYPVIEVIDYLGTASLDLDETMVCENEDYRAFKACFAEEED